MSSKFAQRPLKSGGPYADSVFANKRDFPVEGMNCGPSRPITTSSNLVPDRTYVIGL